MQNQLLNTGRPYTDNKPVTRLMSNYCDSYVTAWTMHLKLHGNKWFFMQFMQSYFRVTIAHIAVIRGQMTTTVGVITKDHVLLLCFKCNMRYSETIALTRALIPLSNNRATPAPARPSIMMTNANSNMSVLRLRRQPELILMSR